jgi:hypothetical protein
MENEATALTCKDHLATKTWQAGEPEPICIGWAGGKLFTAGTVDLGDIFKIAVALELQQSKQHQCLLRGRLTEHGRALQSQGAAMRRLLHSRRNAPATFEDCARNWLYVDADKWTPPGPLKTAISHDPESVIRPMLAELPPELRGVSCAWQLSSSAGFHPEQKVSAHLFFSLAEPITCEEWKRWAAARRQAFPIVSDLRPCNPVQAIYTAGPALIGLDDPCPVRVGLIEARSATARIIPPPPPPAPPPARPVLIADPETGEISELPPGSPRPLAPGSSPFGPAFQKWLREIGRETHEAVNAALYCYASSVNRGASRDDMECINRIRVAGYLAGDGSSRSLDPQELERSLRGAFNRL